MPTDNSLTTAGELYFIRERDVLSGLVSEYVKVGIVKAGGGASANRLSQDRVSEHQTGNPRTLFLSHVINTPAVTFLESKVHGLFAASRVSGEWFRVSEAMLATMIDEAERRVAELRSIEFELIHADDFKLKPSTAEIAPSNDVVREWHLKWLRAEKIMQAIQTVRKSIATLTKEAASRGEDISRVANVQTVARLQFDKDRFKAEFPEIYSTFLRRDEKIAGQFRINREGIVDITIEEAAPGLEGLLLTMNEAIERAEKGDLDPRFLGEQQIGLEPYQASAEWDRDLAESVIKAASGPTGGVEGICSWNRRLNAVETFDQKAFELTHPDLKERFSIVRESTRAVPVNKGLASDL